MNPSDEVRAAAARMRADDYELTYSFSEGKASLTGSYLQDADSATLADYTLALLAAGDAADGWRPISTAPTDQQIRVIGAKSDIVIGDIYYGYGALQIIRLAEPGYEAERMILSWRNTDSGNRLKDHMQPTHWMPLPAPPAPAEGVPSN